MSILDTQEGHGEPIVMLINIVVELITLELQIISIDDIENTREQVTIMPIPIHIN